MKNSLYIFGKESKIFRTYLEILCILHLFIDDHFTCYFTFTCLLYTVSILPTILKRRSLSCCLIDIASAE